MDNDSGTRIECLGDMIKNYILIAARTLIKNRLFSMINIFGLALSMSVCMIVLIRFLDAMHYDDFHQGGERIYRVVSEVRKSEGQEWRLASTPLPLADALREDTLSLEHITTIYPVLNDAASDGVKEIPIRGFFADASFLNVFTFPMKYGDRETALFQPNSIVISAALNEKLFGSVNAIGKIITLKRFGIFQVSGVMDVLPGKSHLTFDALVSMTSIPLLEKENKLEARLANWDSFDQAYTYVKRKDGFDEELLERKLAQLSNDINKRSQSGTFAFRLQSLSAITPGESDLHFEIGRGPSRGSLIAEMSIVLVILVSAAFNYTNLSVARALTRGKEVGIRKLSGAQRWQIFAQYIVEAVIIAFFSLFIASVILELILEYKPFNDGYEMVPSVTFNGELILGFVVFTIFTGVLAGGLPAWILSSFKPARVLRNIGSEKIFGNVSLRKALIVFQFTLSLVILIFLSGFYNQFEYIAKADTGYNRKNILIMPVQQKEEIISTAFNQTAGVKRTGLSSAVFGVSAIDHVKGSLVQHESDALNMQHIFCNSDFVDIMGLKILAGENLSDAPRETDVLINEKAMIGLGLNPLEALGAQFYIRDSIAVTVRGIVKDVYADGYGNPIQPLLLQYVADEMNFIAVEVETGQRKKISSSLEATWKRVFPENSLSTYWLDEKLDDNNDQSAEISMLGFLAFMTITISGMGLLGLVVYTVETRRKEISIRKIIGATVQQVTLLLSGSFVILLLIASVIALPIGYILTNLFLMGFVNRVSFGFVELFTCVSFLLIVGMVTILPQTIKASAENPADNLRSE